MYHQITIVGNVGQDPQMRYTSNGTPVTTISVASNKTWSDSAGNRQSRTTWFRVACWRRLGEVVAQYVRRGSLVLVTGEMQEPRPWQNKDGEWRASLEVTASTVQFLSTPPDTRSEVQKEREDAPPVTGEKQRLPDAEIPF